MILIAKKGSIARLCGDTYVEADERGDSLWNLLQRARIELARADRDRYLDLADIKRVEIKEALSQVKSEGILLDRRDCLFLHDLNINTEGFFQTGSPENCEDYD